MLSLAVYQFFRHTVRSMVIMLRYFCQRDKKFLTYKCHHYRISSELKSIVAILLSTGANRI